MLVLQRSCFGLSLRYGAFVVTALCFAFAILNLVAMFVTVEPKSNTGVSWYIHLSVFLVYLFTSLLLAVAVTTKHLEAMLAWLVIYSVITILSLVGHDLSSIRKFIVDAETVGGITVGIGIFNIVVNLIFLLVVFSYYYEMSFKKVDARIPARPVTTL